MEETPDNSQSTPISRDQMPDLAEMRRLLSKSSPVLGLLERSLARHQAALQAEVNDCSSWDSYLKRVARLQFCDELRDGIRELLKAEWLAGTGKKWE